MSAKPGNATDDAAWKLWLYLTRQERWLVLGILLLALIGLTARYIHLRGQNSEILPDPPAAVDR